MTSDFIKLTAKDYDLPIHIVENIIRKYPDNFYKYLEEELLR